MLKCKYKIGPSLICTSSLRPVYTSVSYKILYPNIKRLSLPYNRVIAARLGNVGVLVIPKVSFPVLMSWELEA